MGLITKDGDLHYYPTSSKYVCSDCFNDEYLKQFIESQEESGKCDFCEKESSETLVADFNDVLEYIRDSIYTEWGDPNDEGVPFEDGEYVFSVKSSDDIFRYEIDLEANPDVLDAIVEAFNDEYFIEKDYETGDLMLSGWKLFVEEIKHRRRYFFSFDEGDRISFDILPSKYLDRLGDEISSLELITTLKPNVTIFRARIHEPGIVFSTAYELGSPPTEHANYANRMSPAGIPMFYGSLDIDTVIKETYRPKKGKTSVATVGKFIPLRELNLIDLTSLPTLPSIFDDQRRYLRPTISFLLSFVDELSRIIQKDDKAHIEYVPTQVFTEYIRHVFKLNDDIKPDGILYPSSINLGGISCVLFFKNEDCCDKYTKERKWKPYTLFLESVEEHIFTCDLLSPTI